ncbi:porin [Otariodibacter oris]|uniref:Putative porin n=1 Tax=Otariodibacter oris TaxID=1032623 RepID=A0A420XJ05_9PAST|nr:porin [Otariodibacter oris]QGM80617.1 hypothetical protein A6A10_03970 [Otariodibacter oris]RKR77226.1 putative porin [Otariodibacter oris]
MKKTLLALAILTFATSASAITIYNTDGTTVNFSGSLRLRLDNERSTLTMARNIDAAVDPALAERFRTDAGVRSGHTNLHNDGSRLEIRAQHQINDDFFAFGRLEFRFNGARTEKGVDDFGSIYVNRAYVGFGAKKYGELSFGRQLTIGDDIPQAGFDEAYSTFDTAMTTSGLAVARYDYKGIEGLQLSVDYRFAPTRDSVGEVTQYTGLKSGYDAGGIYTFGIAEGQEITVSAGYSRDNYVNNENNDKHHKDAWIVGAKYRIDDLELAMDYTGHLDKWKYTGEFQKEKETLNVVRVGARYHFTPKFSVYGNYGYRVFELKGDDHKLLRKAKLHRFMLGAIYQVHEQVMTYVEGGILRGTRNNYEDVREGSILTMKPKEDQIGVGLRIYW